MRSKLVVKFNKFFIYNTCHTQGKKSHLTAKKIIDVIII